MFTPLLAGRVGSWVASGDAELALFGGRLRSARSHVRRRSM